jgi:hypothetical protein
MRCKDYLAGLRDGIEIGFKAGCHGSHNTKARLIIIVSYSVYWLLS